jgi:hypothetical protein
MPSALLSWAAWWRRLLQQQERMETVVIVASNNDYGRLCYDVFRRAGLFAVVVDSGARALVLLAQFRVHVVVVERSTPDPPEWESVLADLAGTTPVLRYRELPKPAALATVVREALASSPNEPARGPLEREQQ